MNAPHSPDPDWRRIAQSAALQIGCEPEVYYYVILWKLSQRPPAKVGEGHARLVLQSSILATLTPRRMLFTAEIEASVSLLKLCSTILACQELAAEGLVGSSKVLELMLG